MAFTISADEVKDLRELISKWHKIFDKVSTVQEAEEMALAVRKVVGQAALEAGLSHISGKSSYQGSSLPCSCGGKRKFVDYRNRWVRSECGDVEIDRAYYYCKDEHHRNGGEQDATPWDKKQGLTRLSTTPKLKALVCRVMGMVPYSDGVSLISELCDIALEESTAEAIVLEVGARIRAQEEQRVDIVKLRLERASAERLMVENTESELLPELKTREVVGKRIYFGVDAMTAFIDKRWQNVQNGIVFTVKNDKDGKDTLFNREYVSGQMSMDKLGWNMRTLSEVWQAGKYSERVFLGDGAPCNWNIADTYFSDAIQILDFYHVSEHIWDLCKVLYNQDNEKDQNRGKRWVSDRLKSLKKFGPRPLIRALKMRKGKTQNQRDAIKAQLQYIQKNEKRMDYPTHVETGRMIGSGPVEAACKSMGGRVKGTGMRWTAAGIDSVLAIRATIKNGLASNLSELAKAA